VKAAQFLIDTRAMARLMRPGAESFGWDQAAAAGLIAVCPVTELEFFHSARSVADRERGIANFRSLFGWVPVHDRAFARAWDVQGELTSKASTGARGR
jgi:predicted nucleic acid-binding protein